MAKIEPSEADIELTGDLFMRRMLRELTGLLQDVVGLDDAEGYINSVGAAMGAWIESQYRSEMGSENLDPEAVAKVFVDLKRRIGGDFYVLEASPDRIVVGNRACPFGDMAKGRDALCMMTSNVFGRIAAENLGYARVELQDTIARNDTECRIVVALRAKQDDDASGREYYRVSRSG